MDNSAAGRNLLKVWFVSYLRNKSSPSFTEKHFTNQFWEQQQREGMGHMWAAGWTEIPTRQILLNIWFIHFQSNNQNNQSNDMLCLYKCTTIMN